MNVIVLKSFEKDLKKLRDKRVAAALLLLIDRLKESASLHGIPHLKKMEHPGPYYRVRIGDYRVGIKLDGNNIILMRVLHRKEVYRYFPG